MLASGGSGPERGLTPELEAALRSLASELGTSGEDLIALVRFETGGTFATDARNPNSGATGLIQFMPSTAEKLGTTTAALANMNHAEQIPVMREYFRRVADGKWAGPAGKLDTTQSLYMAVFYPKYRYEPANKRFPDSVIQANPGITTPADYIRKVQEYNARA